VDAKKQKKILIVEDDFFIREIYETQARKQNYLVLTAADGEDGLNKIRNESPDFVLLDLMLPKLDGFSILKKVKGDPILAKTPILIMTNMEDSNIEREARVIGAVDYLLKVHNTPDSIMSIVEKYFSNGSV
jgi:DNA-binding response OmpR family regulator